MDYTTFMWVKARFDAAEKRVEALDGRLDTLARAVVSLVETLQTQGASQMEQVTRIELALAELKVREQALLDRDSARDAASAQAAADLVVAQAKVQAISEQLASVSADRESIKAQLDELNTHLDTMAVNAEAARDALPPVPVAVDPNLGNSAPAASGSSTDSTSTSDSGTASTSSSTAPASSASPADTSSPADSGAPAASDAGTASAPAATDTPASPAAGTSTPPDPAQVGSADPTGQSAGDTSAVGTPTVVTENVSDGAAASDPVA